MEKIKQDIANAVVAVVKNMLHDYAEGKDIHNGDSELRVRESFESFHDAKDVLNALELDEDFKDAVSALIEEVTWKEPI